jgi:predicted peptidase
MSTSIHYLLGAVVVLLTVTTVRSAEDEPKPGFHDRVFKDPDGKDANYAIFVPRNYSRTSPAPTILFLHGAGETGNDGILQVRIGLGWYVRAHEDTFPFFVIFPQSQKRTWGADSADGQRALAILAQVQKEFGTDPKRTYLTGLSMGGYGTWSMATKYPDKWAAIVPICGGGDPKNIEKIKDIPCWCFHGAEDPAVNVEKSREMIAALKAAGGHPKYTEFPGVKHQSWDQAYATEGLFDWLLEQKLK